MKIHIWGCRGSYISPENNFLEYGGNTTCIELTGKTSNQLIIDAGSGIIRLGRGETGDKKVYHIILTHTHIDHLQGFAFFKPIHDKSVIINIYCVKEQIHSVKETFERLFKSQYSPIQAMGNLQAEIKFNELNEMGTYEINGFKVSPVFTQHPLETFAYKIEENSSTFGFITDHEVDVKDINDKVIKFFRNTSLILHDGQLIDEEYEKQKGWGHSTMTKAVENGIGMNSKKLGIIHHSPEHNDSFLGKYEKLYVDKYKDEIELLWVKEGMDFIV
jgi:phosphoribosyl 1,2-cyclic phosphodiesterase